MVVAFYTLLSRILGLCRELFIATMFGSGPIADSVNVAFKLPNLFRRIFAEGALSSVFVPIFNRKMIESDDAAEKFASKIFYLLLLTLIILVGVTQLLMQFLMLIIAPGFHLEPEKFTTTVLLCRITMPYLICISLAALLGGMLNSISKFAAFAFVPVVLNVVVIVGSKSLEHYIAPEKAIAYSVILAGIMQICFMWIAARRNHLRIRLPQRINIYDHDIKLFLILMIPATISSGTAQINLFISQSIASFIPGAVSILSYAERIYQFPLSIIGIAFGTILLPTLSRLYKIGDMKQVFLTQNNAIKFALFLSVPCSAGIIVLSHQIIHIIYEHGAFTSTDTIKTAEALAGFAIGLPAFILTKIFMPIFYANQDTKTPMKITIYALTVNTLLNIALMIPFEHVGIALGSSIAAWYNVWLLVRYAKQHGYLCRENDIGSYTLKICISSLILSVVILFLGYYIKDYHYSTSIMTQILALGVTIIIGIVTYVISAFCFGVIDKNIIRAVRKI